MIRIKVSLTFLFSLFSTVVFAVVPWEQIPWEVPPTLEQNYKYYFQGAQAPTETGAIDAWAAAGVPVRTVCETLVKSSTDTKTLYEVKYFQEGSGSCEFFSTVTDYVSRESTNSPVCSDPNYPIENDIDGDGDPDSCNRGVCGSTNSAGDMVISGGNGVPTQMEVDAGVSQCFQTGPNGEYCVNTAVSAEGMLFWSDSQSWVNGGNETTGNVCGSLTATPDNPDGTVADGTQSDVDYCYGDLGTMWCYQDPAEVCPNNVCQLGCAQLGTEAICSYSSDGQIDGSADGSGQTPPIDGSGFDEPIDDGTGTDTGTDTGTGTGTGGGGGGGDDALPEPDPEECVPTDNTVCGKNDFYEANDWDQKNFGTVIGNFRDRVLSSEIGVAGSNFFNISTGGQCQVWSVNAWVFSIVLDQHCSATVQALFPWISAIVMALASFVGFRWAFL